MKHPSCNFVLNGTNEVSSLISESLNTANPLSLIRLGDGEGLLLSISDKSPEIDINYLATHLGSNGVILQNLLHLNKRLIESIKNADVIGVRDDIVDVTFEPKNFSLPPSDFLEIFRKSFRLREVEKSLDYHGSRRIAYLHNNLGDLDLKENIQFCSAWFQYDYHNSGEIFNVIRSHERIGVISCRPQLPALLEEMFGVSVEFYEIPDMHRNLPDDAIIPDYLEQLESVLRRQLVEFPGMLYLVGGGLYGKLYCQLIKSQGGVALDLGSLFDAWLGIPSRPNVYRSMFYGDSTTNSVPSGLILTEENMERLLCGPRGR